MKLNEVVAKYVELRDKKTELKADYDKKVLKIDTVLDQIEARLLAAYDAAGMESVRTAEGTAYISTKTGASVADRELFTDFAYQNKELGMLDVRANKTAVATYIEEHQVPPPGVNWYSERTINVKRN